jgi:F-type H+-transporting ATPase subunit a
MKRSKLKNIKPAIARNLILAFAVIIFLVMQVVALDNRQDKTDDHKALKEEIYREEVDAGKIILGHIVDAHEWHILSVGDFHLTIPLPVILWHDGKLHVFMSGKFHHGHDDYKGFGIGQEGFLKGKVVRTLQDRFITDGVIVHDEDQDLPLDFSITKNVLAIFMSIFFLSWIFISIAKRYQLRRKQAPKGLQSFVEPLIIFIRDDIAKSSIGPHYEKFMPYLLTLFFFIFFNNLMGLVPIFPGGANVTGNLAVTFVLAFFTFFMTNLYGNKNYWQHIFNTPGVPWWLKVPIPLMPIVELLGVFTKPLILMIRLFANISAGHFIILGFISLIFIFGQTHALYGYGISVVSLLFAIFINVLELLVAFIQAYVFTLLSALYLGIATEEHH